VSGNAGVGHVTVVLQKLTSEPDAVVQLVTRICLNPVPLFNKLPLNCALVLDVKLVAATVLGVVAPIVVLLIVELTIAAPVNLANPYIAITVTSKKKTILNNFFMVL